MSSPDASPKRCSRCPAEACANHAYCRACRAAYRRAWNRTETGRATRARAKTFPSRQRTDETRAKEAYRRRLNPRCGWARPATKAWAKAHPEAHRARSARWSARHPDRLRAIRRRNAWKHRLYSAIKAEERRALLRGLATTVTVKEWREILEVFDHSCAYCLDDTRTLTMDHVVALAAGGEHVVANVVPACPSCNSRKRNAPVFLMVSSRPRLVRA